MTTEKTTMTLEDALKEAITTFVTANKPFSSYEVVTKLRESLNTGALIVDSLPMKDWHGSKRQALYSRDVIGPISKLFDDGFMPGYQKSKGVSPEGKKYTLFSPPVTRSVPTLDI